MNIYLTGATSGLGEHLAYEYAKRGAFLALSGRRRDKLDSVASKCEELGAKVITYCLDVTDQHATKESIDDFLSKISNIDLVIANAGYGFVDKLHKGDPTELNKVIDTNVNGVINTVVPFMPSMIKKDIGPSKAITNLQISGKINIFFFLSNALIIRFTPSSVPIIKGAQVPIESVISLFTNPGQIRVTSTFLGRVFLQLTLRALTACFDAAYAPAPGQAK